MHIIVIVVFLLMLTSFYPALKIYAIKKKAKLTEVTLKSVLLTISWIKSKEEIAEIFVVAS